MSARAARDVVGSVVSFVAPPFGLEPLVDFSLEGIEGAVEVEGIGLRACERGGEGVGAWTGDQAGNGAQGAAPGDLLAPGQAGGPGPEGVG